MRVRMTVVVCGLSWHSPSHPPPPQRAEWMEQRRWKGLEMEKQWDRYVYIHTHQHQCLWTGTHNAGSSSGNQLDSYLCQVGIDPFCECPFLHSLLLICKSEPNAPLSVTCLTMRGFKHNLLIVYCFETWLGFQSRLATLINFYIIASQSHVSERSHTTSHHITPYTDVVRKGFWHLKMTFCLAGQRNPALKNAP